MSIISFKEFDVLYKTKVDNINKFLTDEIQNLLSKHNYTWRQFNFRNYFLCSSNRYYIAYKSFYKIHEGRGKPSYCDIGGLFGIFPLVLKELGFKVAFTEALKYYDKSFNKLFDYLGSSGIEIIDTDPFDENFNVSEKFDIVSAMAILEHYPYSPKLFFHNVLKILNKPGSLYIEVPNIAYYYKRKDLVFGKTPLNNMQDIYNSAVPFTGHHHEYTYKELLFLLNENNLKPGTINFYTYSYKFDIKFILKNPLSTICQSLFPSCKEVMAVNSLYEI